MSQSGEEYASEVARVASGRAKARTIRPLRGILPFLKPYRWRIAWAAVALVVSSTATLVLPMAGRQIIDHGFDQRAAALIGKYFLAFIGVAAVMGISSATRFYFVTWIGERVVADVRKAVFDNVLSLTPAFFEVTRTGEVISRLTADTTLIQTVVVVGLGRVAKSRDPGRRLPADVRDQSQAGCRRGGRRVGGDDPAHRVRPLGAHLEPQEPGPRRRHQRARQRDAARGADGAGLHA